MIVIASWRAAENIVRVSSFIVYLIKAQALLSCRPCLYIQGIRQQRSPRAPVRSWHTPNLLHQRTPHKLRWHRLWRFDAALWGAQKEDLNPDSPPPTQIIHTYTQAHSVTYTSQNKNWKYSNDLPSGPASLSPMKWSYIEYNVLLPHLYK